MLLRGANGVGYTARNTVRFLDELQGAASTEQIRAGIPLNGLYADEMHIQQDWGYADHHEEGQFAVRYLTPHLATKFADIAREGVEAHQGEVIELRGDEALAVFVVVVVGAGVARARFGANACVVVLMNE